MKAGRLCFVGVLCLSLLGAVSYGEPAEEATQGCMGIILHPGPLPPILAKHLRLEPDEGTRIVNVQADSPADKAGLERDDIIIGLGDDALTNREAFVDAVRAAGAGNEISLKIIHLGERKTVKLTLMSIEEMSGRGEWKYPPEPEPMESWQPGRMWFMQPGDKGWSEIPWNDLLENPRGPQDWTELFKEIYKFRHRQDGQDFSITIEGDPADKEAWVTVRSGNTEYKVAAKDIDELPKEYRQPVRDALERAREQKALKPHVFKMPSLPKMPNLNRQDFFEDLRRLRPQAPAQPKDDALDTLGEQMRQLQKEMEKLRKHQEEMAEQLRQTRKPAGTGI